ncbi:uncharacterized protein LOC141900038 [Tubulanus polymorphus]|uniref:uncharacterized protein LOC141900038 n=1 Tax=Tubulanus polymorphus TaxID=672921 RepID=UPI003DA55F52
MELEETFKKKWELSQKLLKHDVNRGSLYPPMNIEHMPHERQRLAGKGMTAEDRMLRKQWLQDQVLSPNEPRHIPELRPRNIFRRIYTAPWDFFFKTMEPILGAKPAAIIRYFAPKYLMFAAGGYLAYYHLKYNRSDWDQRGGWHMWTSRAPLLPGDAQYPKFETKEKSDYANYGFKDRTAFKEKIRTTHTD